MINAKGANIFLVIINVLSTPNIFLQSNDLELFLMYSLANFSFFKNFIE